MDSDTTQTAQAEKFKMLI